MHVAACHDMLQRPGVVMFVIALCEVALRELAFMYIDCVLPVGPHLSLTDHPEGTSEWLCWAQVDKLKEKLLAPEITQVVQSPPPAMPVSGGVSGISGVSGIDQQTGNMLHSELHYLMPISCYNALPTPMPSCSDGLSPNCDCAQAGKSIRKVKGVSE